MLMAVLLCADTHDTRNKMYSWRMSAAEWQLCKVSHAAHRVKGYGYDQLLQPTTNTKSLYPVRLFTDKPGRSCASISKQMSTKSGCEKV